jgi:hypothetical protein
MGSLLVRLSHMLAQKSLFVRQIVFVETRLQSPPQEAPQIAPMLPLSGAFLAFRQALGLVGVEAV